jgi:hypothetical protein
MIFLLRAGREIVAWRATKSGVGAILIPDYALLRLLGS